MAPMVELTPAIVRDLPKTGPTDPIEFYRRPIVGWLFRERINRGLRLLPQRRYDRALELAYGAGALQVALADSVGELHGIDLDADPAAVGKLLAGLGHVARLVQGSVYEMPYEDRSFDLVFSFSLFEHLHEPQRALREVTRVLRPGGHFLLGMPSVNRTMEVGFRLIGFRGIDHHHVTTPAAIARAFDGAGLRVLRRAFLDVPPGLRLYHNWLLEKVA